MNTNNTLLVFLIFFSMEVLAENIFTTVPDTPDQSKKYIFYLHGVGVERNGPDDANEDYHKILRTFAEKGFTVISESRPEGTKYHAYGEKIAAEVELLINNGVPAKNITVVGYSKGGRIALRASAILGNSNINYVILAGCIAPHRKYYEKFIDKYASDLSGNILSIFDEDDSEFDSCKTFFGEAYALVTQKEIILRTGKGHQLFHNPTENWITPVVNWANGGLQ